MKTLSGQVEDIEEELDAAYEKISELEEEIREHECS